MGWDKVTQGFGETDVGQIMENLEVQVKKLVFYPNGNGKHLVSLKSG